MYPQTQNSLPIPAETSQPSNQLPYPGFMIGVAIGTHWVASGMSATLAAYLIMFMSAVGSDVTAIAIQLVSALPGIGCLIWLITMLAANLKRLPSSAELSEYPWRLSATKLLLVISSIYLALSVLSPIQNVLTQFSGIRISQIISFLLGSVSFACFVAFIISIIRYNIKAKLPLQQ